MGCSHHQRHGIAPLFRSPRLHLSRIGRVATYTVIVCRRIKIYSPIVFISHSFSTSSDLSVINIAKDLSIVSIIVIRLGLGLIPQVRVSLARGVTHLAHERGEMGTKRCSSTLQSIQGARAHDEGILAGVGAEFRANLG